MAHAPREADHHGPSSGSAFASLRHQQFRWLYASNIAFFFAMNGQFLVRSILAYDLTGSKLALGIINLAVAIPMLVVSPFGGVLADRMERRGLIMTGQALLLCNELFVLVLLLTGHLQFWHLLLVVFFMGCLFPFIMPARQAIVANIVGRQGLSNAMALQMGAMNAARVVGPVLAGTIVALTSVEWVYLMAVVLYSAALVSMSRVSKSVPAEGAARQPVLSELAAGMKYVAGDAPVRALLVLSIVPILLAMPFQSLLVVFAEDVWKVGDGGLGLLQAFAGFGGILGSLYVAWAGESQTKLRLMMSTLLAFAATLFLFAFSPWFLLALPLVLIADVFANVFNTTNGTIIQVLIPDAVRGRVMSLMMMTFGLTPLGTLPVSIVAEAFGVRVAVASASVATALLAVAIYFASRALRHIDVTSREAALAELESERMYSREAAPASAAG
ncbi:MAG: MFS transporter [Dehalococcoidia bacterium]|nr:MFS transporter [Dehalococcoidia bacterium]